MAPFAFAERPCFTDCRSMQWIWLLSHTLSSLQQAHQNGLACVALNSEGTLLATASEVRKKAEKKEFIIIIIYYNHICIIHVLIFLF